MMTPIIHSVPFTFERGNLKFSLKTDLTISGNDIVLLNADGDAAASEFVQVLVGLDQSKRITSPAARSQLVRVPVAGSFWPGSPIKLCGAPIEQLTNLERAKSVAVVFDNPEFSVIGTTVAEEFRYTMAALGIMPPEYPDALVLSPYDLYEKLDRDTHVLSGGELHRLAIACAMERDAKLLILDLTRSNLDADFEHWLFNRLNLWLSHQQNRHGGAAMIIVGVEQARLPPIANARLRQFNLNSKGELATDIQLANMPSSGKAIAVRRKGQLLLEAIDLGRSHYTRCRQSFRIHEGEILCFHGPNGSGKTSIARLVCGQEQLSNFSGALTTHKDVYPAIAIQHAERSFLHPTVRQEIGDYKFASKLGFSNEELEDHPRCLSYQKQKLLSVAVAIKHATGIAVLDEPSCGMDAITKGRLLDLINSHPELAFLIFTHDMELRSLFSSKLFGTGAEQ